jgi:RNA recognition motif-containing protein
MPKDFEGRILGYCFIQFESDFEVIQALRKDNTEIRGRKITVKDANESDRE